MGGDISDKSEPDMKVTVVDLEEGLPQYAATEKQSRWRTCVSLFRRSLQRRNPSEESPWPKLIRHMLYLLLTALVLFAIAAIIYHSLLINLVKRLSPPKVANTGLDQLVEAWVEPGTVQPTPAAWLPNFSRDIIPKAIHSHNDYWRHVPLFEALSLGITGVEADCHLIGGELYVGHTNSSLRPNRTFRSLYLDPLATILEKQNAQSSVTSNSKINGVWDTEPSTSIVVMTDLKTEGFSTLEAVQTQLQSFREKGWLTYWNGTDIILGPIIHVGTGNTPFEAVLNSTYANSTYRDVFFDAPLHKLSSMYNNSNSYYSSTSLTGLFGAANIPHSGLKKSQMMVVKAQIDLAKSLGLVSRYWDIPGWPVDTRTKIWDQLEQAGVGMLNADAISIAARWNWRWCNVLGLHLC